MNSFCHNFLEKLRSQSVIDRLMETIAMYLCDGAAGDKKVHYLGTNKKTRLTIV